MANQTIDKVVVEVEATAKGTSAVFSQLTSQISIIKSALNSLDTSKLEQVTKATKSVKVDSSGMTKSEKDISSSIDKIKQSLAGLNSYKNAALSGDSSSLTSFNRQVIRIQSQIDILGEKLIQLGNNKTGVSIDTDTFQTYRDQLAEVQSALTTTSDQVTSTVATMNSEQPNIDTEGVSSGLSDIAAKASEAASSLWAMTKSGIKTGFSSLKSSLSKIKDTLTNIGSKASNTASTGFSKILKYGFGIRSMYVLFRRLRTAVKDSFTELQNSGAYYQTTKANIDALKSSLSTLKYQFGAAFEPIFNTVAPALQTLINYLVTVMNTISAFIAKLTGKSTYSKAVASTAAIADNTGSAAGSAAELNKQLQGFDELNNISPDSGSSGGSGGGSSSDSSSVTYVEESVDSALTSFWDSLADAINNGEWYKAGTIISDALTSAMESIEWDDIFEAASDFGINLAAFLNGLITDDLFYQLGRTIANSIKTALIAVLSFGLEFDWKGLGTAIASGINGFVDQNPLDLAVDAFNVWANGILDTLIAAVDNVSWTTIAQHIADAIGEIDTYGIMWRLGTLVTSLANALKDLVSNKETWTNLGTKIAEGINGFFEGFDGSSVAYLLNNLIKGLESMVYTALTKVDWGEIGKDIVEFIGNIDLGNIAIVIGGAYLAAGAYTILASAIKTLITTNVMSVVGGMGTVSGGTVAVSVVVAAAIGWKIGTKLYESASGHEVEQGFVDEIQDIWDGFTKDKVKFNLLDFIEFSVEDADGWYGDYRDWVYDLVDSITADFNILKTSVKTAWQSVWYGNGSVQHGYNGATSEAVNYIEGTGQGIDSDMNEYGANLWNGIVEGFKKAMLYTNPLLAPIALLKDKIAEWFKEKFGIESPAKKMYYYGEMLWRGIYEGFKEAMSNYSLSDLINNLSVSILGTGKEKTGLTAQGDFSSDDAISKTHSKTGQSGNGGGSSAKINVTYNTKLTGAATSRQGLSDLKESFANLNTEASKSTEATYSAKTGGQLSDINTLDTWRQKIRNLISSWTSQSATMRANVGGQMTSIDDTETWIEKIQKLDQEWQNAASSTSFNVTSDVSNLDGQGGYLERLNKAKEEWKKNNPTATFTTTLSGSVTTTDGIDTLASSFKTLKENYPSGSHSSSWSTSISGKSASDISTYANAVKSLYDKFYTGSHTASYTVSLSGNYSGVDALVETIMNKINKKMGKYKIKVDKIAASGGAFFGGSWHNIPQYASGTLNAGSVFVAGEAGPEIVGQINGRTEVLNKSQIASIMNASYIQAMGQFGNRLLSTTGLQYNMSSYNGYNSSSGNENSYMMAQQNELLREQNDLLRTIASKDVSISSRDVFKATQSEANNYYNRTGNSPFLY